MHILNFSGHPVNGQTVASVMGVASDLVNKGENEIVLLLSSPGGNVNEGVALYNFLKGLPVELTTFNIGQVDSIANVIFLAGAKRYAVPTSAFFFHDVGISIEGNFRFIEKDLEERLAIIRRDRRKIIDVMTAECHVPSDRLNDLFVHGESIDAIKASEYGIIHEIKPFEAPPGAQILTFNFK